MELSINDLKDLVFGQDTSPSVGANHPFRVGEKFLFRAVTYHMTGEITEVRGNWVTLKDAAWIADSGRFADALQSCEFSEVEPVPDGTRLNLGSVTDAEPISRCPTEQR